MSLADRSLSFASRALRPSELRLAPTNGGPIVVESESPGTLSALVDRSSAPLRALLDAHGAVLFRGFGVRSAPELEDAIVRFDGSRPMRGYFMSEAGRDRLPGANAVFTTNSLRKIGGGMAFGGFHSENFYSLDVPARQVFWCRVALLLGGETAVVDGAALYDSLSDGLRARLDALVVLARALPLDVVAARYGLPVDTVDALLREGGVQVDGAMSERRALVVKPVVHRGLGGRRSLTANLSAELPGLDAKIRAAVAPLYAGLPWSVHRLAWSAPSVLTFLRALDDIFIGDPHPRAISRRLGASLRRRPPAASRAAGTDPPRLASCLSPDDVDEIASAVSRHLVLFRWEAGDVLLVDNMRVLHAGMPGFGARDLGVMMCDPVPGERLASADMRHDSTPHVSWSERLENAAQGAPTR